MRNWDAVARLALALPGTEAGTSYGRPAIKVAATGRAFVGAGSVDGSFVLHIDGATKDMLIATEPDPFWQTPHYEGWAALLVRYDVGDGERIAAMIERARDQAAARPPVRRRTR